MQINCKRLILTFIIEVGSTSTARVRTDRVESRTTSFAESMNRDVSFSSIRFPVILCDGCYLASGRQILSVPHQQAVYDVSPTVNVEAEDYTASVWVQVAQEMG
jgi:hypothetical protein